MALSRDEFDFKTQSFEQLRALKTLIDMRTMLLCIAIFVSGCATKGEWLTGKVAYIPGGSDIEIAGDTVGLVYVHPAGTAGPLKVVDSRGLFAQPSSWQNLRIGMKIRMQTTGAVAESYPGQVWAYEVDIVR